MFNAVTGASSRHNKALRDVGDWAATVQKFLMTYDLYGNASFTVLLENVGNAKFDLTGLAYNGRPLINAAAKIKGSEISDLITGVITGIENLRRFLINPEMQTDKVNDSVYYLRVAYEKLQETINNTDYL